MDQRRPKGTNTQNDIFKKKLSRICMQFFPLNSFLKILSGWIPTDLLLLIPFQRFERIKSPILMD
jgi:hypothetical protein